MEDLRPFKDTVACLKCSEFGSNTQEAVMSEKRNTNEDQCKNNSTPLFSVSVSEYETGSGMDHAVYARVRTGGLSLEFNTTVDKIRKFFTEKREKATKLKSVP